MSSGALGARLCVPHNRRPKRFRYSEWQTIWLERNSWTRGSADGQYNGP